MTDDLTIENFESDGLVLGYVTRTPDVEKALMHLSAAAVEADLGMTASSWDAGEMPVRAWWKYREALDAIKRAEYALKEIDW